MHENQKGTRGVNQFLGFILTFVNYIRELSRTTKKKTMQIRNNTLITECSAYDFKEMLERKKVKSWLKSVSAFCQYGSIFFLHYIL